MKEAIAKQWVTALRSGDYQQGKGQLRTEQNEFCCLGVLCNLHAQAHPQIAAGQPSRYQYMGNEHVLPRAVMQWAGMKHEAGVFGTTKDMEPAIIKGRSYSLLTNANDDGCNFAEIADAIEQNWRKL